MSPYNIAFQCLTSGKFSERTIASFPLLLVLCMRIDGEVKWTGPKLIEVATKFMAKVFIPVAGSFLEIINYPCVKTYWCNLASMGTTKIVSMEMFHTWLIKKLDLPSYPGIRP